MLARFDLRAALPRLPGLVVGLVLFGLGIAVMKEAGLGLGPWESLHDGLGLLTGQPLGTISIVQRTSVFDSPAFLKNSSSWKRATANRMLRYRVTSRSANHSR